MGSERDEVRDFADVVDRVIATEIGIHQVAEGIADGLVRFVDMDWASISLIDRSEERAYFIPLAARINWQLDLGNNMYLSGSPIEWVTKNKCGMMESDLTWKSKFVTGPSLRRQGITTVVYMPLFSGREVCGVIMVGCYRPNAYKNRELNILKYAANQLSPSVEAELDKLLEEAKRAEAPEPEKIEEPQAMGEEEKPAEAISEVSGETEQLAEHPSISEEEKPVEEAVKESETEKEGAVTMANEATEVDARFATILEEAQKKAEEYFAIYVEQGRHKAEEFKESSVAQLSSLVEAARNVVEEAQMRAEESRMAFDKAQKAALDEAQKEEEGQAFINSLVGAIACGNDLSQALQGFADQLKNRIGFDRITCTTIEGNSVRILWSISLDNTSPKAREVYPQSECGTPQVMELGETNIENDLTLNRQFVIDGIHVENGIRSIIRLPLCVRSKTFATLNLASSQPNAYGEEDRKFLEEVCAQLAPVLQKSQIQGKENERLEFLDAVVHEVRTPLTSIISSSKLLKEEIKQSPGGLQSRLVDNVVNSADSMEKRLSQFFDLANVRTPDFKLETEMMDIKALLEESALQVIPIAQSGGKLLILELHESLPQVEADRKRIKQVATTLLNHAISVSPQGSVIKLRAGQQDKRLVVEITDSGPGYSSEEQKEMFKSYVPSGADRQQWPEMRLGLAVAKQLVELHGGNLWLESESGKKSTFRFSLPIE